MYMYVFIYLLDSITSKDEQFDYFMVETIQALNQKGFTVANQEIIHSGDSQQPIRNSFKH